MTKLTILQQSKRKSGGVEVGIVKISDGRNFIIENSGDVLKSEKAFSCLIEPVPGDKVLFCEDPGGQSYILSILERTDTRTAMVQFENGACIQSASQPVHVEAAAINLNAVANLNLSSSNLNVNAHTGKVFLDSLTMLGSKAKVQWRNVQFGAIKLQILAGTLMQKVQNAFRFVKDLEQNKIGRLRYETKESMTFKGKRARIEAEKNVALQGDKILIG
jgi:hypothetical protein